MKTLVLANNVDSTLYTKRNGKWLASFHQETPAAPAPPTSKPAAAPAKK